MGINLSNLSPDCLPFSLVVTDKIQFESTRARNKPKLKIESSRVEIHNGGTEGKFKDLYFSVRNVGGEEARDCVFEIRVKGLWRDFCSMQHTKDIYPDKKETFHLCQIVKTDESMVIGGRRNLPLDRGKAYTLEIRFFGRNFKDREIHILRLDFSSWEDIGIELDS